MKTAAFTLLEIVIALTVIGILASISAAGMAQYVDRARVADAVMTMKSIEDGIAQYLAENGRLPDSLADLPGGAPKDPWGNPYQFTNLSTAPPGAARKDKFLVPINSDFDLWSMGPDGKSVPPLTAKASRDDIIRASDGAYYGQASAY